MKENTLKLNREEKEGFVSPEAMIILFEAEDVIEVSGREFDGEKTPVD